MHLFHFKISNTDLTNLSLIKELLFFKTYSKTLEFIFDKSIKHLKQIIYSSGNHNSRIPLPENRLISKKIKLLEKDYRHLKNFHSKNNFFSIAIIIRAMIDFFVLGMQKNKSMDRFLKTLEKTKSFFKNKFTSKETIEKFIKMVHISNNYLINIKLLNKFIYFLSSFY